MAVIPKIRSDQVHRISIALYDADGKVLVARRYGGHWIETLLRDLTLVKMMFIPKEKEPREGEVKWPQK